MKLGYTLEVVYDDESCEVLYSSVDDRVVGGEKKLRESEEVVKKFRELIELIEELGKETN